MCICTTTGTMIGIHTIIRGMGMILIFIIQADHIGHGVTIITGILGISVMPTTAIPGIGHRFHTMEAGLITITITGMVGTIAITSDMSLPAKNVHLNVRTLLEPGRDSLILNEIQLYQKPPAAHYLKLRRVI